MGLDKAQRGVATGMGAAVIFSAIILILAWVFKPWSVPDFSGPAGRIGYVLQAAIVPCLWLLVSVGNVARERFFSPADINGSGLSEASARIRVGAAVLQNTLEQSVLAVGALLSLAATASDAVLVLVWPLVILFSIGRLTFWAGYAHGAPARAFGFGTTFYPTIFAYLLAVVLLIV
jgi:hypothetical protein